VVIVFAIAGADPVLKLFTWLTNLGALGVPALMARAPGRIEVASVADRVYAALREQILAGDLEPESRLHQEGISAELGVSLPTAWSSCPHAA
jgi:hypothetical protein